MISLALLDRRSNPIGFRASLDPAFLIEHFVDLGDSSRAFGMVSRIVLFKDRAVVQKHVLDPSVLKVGFFVYFSWV
jgi:hypothetical protein